MVAKVRKFNTGISDELTPTSAKENSVPDIPVDAIDRIIAHTPVHIRGKKGNPRQRRYKQKTYSVLQEDIDLIEMLVSEIRQAGLYERGRSDIVRAGVWLLNSLSLQEKINAINNVKDLKDN